MSVPSSYNLWELIPFALLGVLGGLWGPTFVRLCMQWVYIHRRAANLHRHPVAEAAAAGALCAVVACIVPVMKHNSNVILGSSLLSALEGREGEKEGRKKERKKGTSR